jgi:ribosome-associated protein
MPKRKACQIVDFTLEGRPFIALSNLLKVEGWCEHGAAAKHLIDSGAVTVDGDVELRRRCKVVAGQVVRLGEEAVKVVA